MAADDDTQGAALDRARATATDLLALARTIAPPEADLAPPKRLRWFAVVDRAAKDAKAAEGALRALRDEYHEQVLSALDAMGLQRAPLQGGPTVYRTRELWAGYDYPDDATDDEKAAVRAAAHDALKKAGLGDYVQEGTNTQSLSAYFRDLERELEAAAREADGLPEDAPVALDPTDVLPPELADHIRLTEKIYPKAKTS